MKNLQFRVIIILAVIILGIYFIIPTVQWYLKSPEEQFKLQQEKNKILKKILNLGLDLRGGIHLVLEIDKDKVSPEVDLSDAIDRAIEIIRNRVDQYGVTEAMITKQGEKWISVQLPGIKDVDIARELIGKTALLEFRLVETGDVSIKITEKIRELGLKPREAITSPEVLSLIPTGYVLLPGREDDVFIVKSTPEITGAYLTTAKLELGGGEFGLPYVSLEFDREGAKIFSRVTEANIDRHLAIVLDDVVQSAPVIRSRIPDGRAIIEGNFSLEDAKFIATILRAGALPAPVKIIEERTVGPTLGKDSVVSGTRALLVGGMIVILFMLIYYKFSGFVTDFVLFLNIFLIFSFMSAFRATFSFPALAGVVLMIGMGVDANILILERIKEELRNGKTLRVAVDLGYQRALKTIIDSNLTTIITTVFLFGFGTGPIKGFGITMLIGLLVNIFTSVVVTKVIYEYVLYKNLVNQKFLF